MAQPLSFFSPHALAVGARERGCLTCDHFKGDFFGGHVVCEQQARPRVIGDATIGCAFWLRATGSDDNFEPHTPEEVEATYRESVSA